MAVIRYSLLQLIILLFWPIKTATQSEQSTHCLYECGNITIRYPFGIGKGCYLNKSFEVFCDYSSGSPRALLTAVSRLELLDLETEEPGSLGYYYDAPVAVVSVPVISLNSSESTGNSKGVDLSGTPFTFSMESNTFTAIGCEDYTTITSNNNAESSSNVSNSGGCHVRVTCDPTKKARCYDFLCPILPETRKVFNASMSSFYSQNITGKCRSVSIFEKKWLDPNDYSNFFEDGEQVPAVLEWGKFRGMCDEEYSSNENCNLDKDCWIPLNSYYSCICSVDQGICSGELICNNTNFYDCSDFECPDGYIRGNYSTYCYRKDGILNRISKVKIVVIGCSSGLGLVFLLLGMWWLYKFVKRRREIKLKLNFFKRNGGLLLRQELSSSEGNIEKTKLFKSKELEKATDNYNPNRILGQGGQGTVYKGMLADGKIVAVKKSKIVDESNVEQFINELVILSQINHRNVVKLFGCCLETEVPLLVYEFIPNGTLFQHLHDQKEEFPLTWEKRLRFAVEVSGALSYLHSAASIPIYHRDIKSANILLDDKYRAKVSDFGASRSVMVDQTHLTTQVQGTFGYVDPEYFRSSQFTEKSDVYSFGVVLVELLTGEKPIRSIDSEENRSLAAYFLEAMKDNRLFEILDAGVLQEAQQEEITTVATLAKRCLNLNGKKRPTMKEVEFELAAIRAPNGASLISQTIEEIDSVDGDITEQ